MVKIRKIYLTEAINWWLAGRPIFVITPQGLMNKEDIDKMEKNELIALSKEFLRLTRTEEPKEKIIHMVEQGPGGEIETNGV